MEKNNKEEESLFSQDDFDMFSEISEMVEESATETQEEEQDLNNLIATQEEENTNEDEDVVGNTGNGSPTNEDEANSETIASDDEDEDEDENSSLFTPYAKLLVDNDILSTLDIDQFDGTADGLKTAMNQEINYHVEKYKETLPSDVKRLVDGYEAGIPFDKMLKISSERIKYDNIQEDTLSDNIDLQKNLIVDYMKKTTQFNDVKISKMIERLEDNAELEEEAKGSLVELRQLQDVEEQNALKQSQVELEQYKQNQTEMLTKLQSHIDTTTEIIPGVKVNKIMKDKITKNLTVPVAYDEYENPINKVGMYSRNNPIEFEVILNYIFEATNEFKDWSVLGKTGKSKAIKELEIATRSLDNHKKGGVRSKKATANQNDLYDAISSFGV